ncbi:MAG: EutP/PduV family microcompartment system protein [Desulfovibrio sp.]|uniref:EutP/PduV family microcompartment system protein n=1 Tax=Desulfovibrio sp. TaxID=885 RepID=UPI002A361ACE|nr:EutP/PduV family microcompartment system protein [Desulfovibrio sp.]MDY0258958.1 EutP/PduV family microcompartment system protein [Desulfovibrio sp.]
MGRIMLLGERGAGRRSLARALGHAPAFMPQPMAVEFAGRFVIPPPEFLENRRFYRALITVSMDCSTLLFVQDATRCTSAFPPGFARIFNRHVAGIITKTDMPEASIERATRFLNNAGLKNIYALSVLSDEGLDTLRQDEPALFA